MKATTRPTPHTTAFTLLAIAASLGSMSSGCATLNELINGGGAAPEQTRQIEGLPEGPRTLSASEEVAKEAGWSLLTAEDVRAKGACKALSETSPAKEYWLVDDCNERDSGKLSWFRGEPKGFYKTYLDQCYDDVLGCSFVPKALAGEPLDDHRKLFQGLLLMHDKELVDAVVGGSAYNIYYGGSFFNERQFGFFGAIEGVGILGHQGDRPYLDGIVDQQWKADNLGRDLRNRVTRSYWWLGDKAAAPMLMSMLTRENATRHQNREFRMIILATLTAWESDEAVDFCQENLRDLGNEDRTACMFYLNSRGKGDASTFLRYIEDSDDEGYFVLGQTGSAEAREYLAKEITDNYIEPVVGLIMAGDKKALTRFDKEVRTTKDWHNARTVRALAYFAGTPLEGKALGWVKAIEESFSAEGYEQDLAMAQAIRAQLGDKSIIPTLVKKIDGPDEAVRETITRHIGGSWGLTLTPYANTMIVADEDLYKGLIKAIQNESDDGNRERMTNAALNIRARLRVLGK